MKEFITANSNEDRHASIWRHFDGSFSCYCVAFKPLSTTTFNSFNAEGFKSYTACVNFVNDFLGK